MLSRESWVKISQLRTLSTERLSHRLGRLTGRDTEQLVNGLLELIG